MKRPAVLILTALAILPIGTSGLRVPRSSSTHGQSMAPFADGIYLPLACARSGVTTPVSIATATRAAAPTISPTATASPLPASPTPTLTLSATATPTDMPSPTLTQPPTMTPTRTPVALIIGHITAAHIGLAWLESQRLPLVVRTLTQEAQVMVDTGDCTWRGTAAECAEYADLVSSSVTIPWRAVLGPHDSPHTFDAYIGPLEWTWDIGDYRLIGINTEAINYTALDDALSKAKPCIIFGHFPLERCSPDDQQKLRQRFLEYDVPIYVAGEAYHNSLQTDPHSGTLLLAGVRTVRCHYRLITVRGFEIENVEFKLACR